MNEKSWFGNNWRLGAYLSGMILSAQFILLSFAAMLFYPGGYSFYTDPLSALGFTRVSGESNLISSILFNPSMFLVGVGVVIFFTALLPFFTNTLIEKWFSISGTIFAVFSGIAMCGAALTPGDIHFEAHVAFAPFTFLFGILMVFFYSVPMFLNEEYPNRYAGVAIIYVILMVIFLALLIVGPSYDTSEGAMFQTTTQKFAIYTEIITLIILSYGAWMLQRSKMTQSENE
ncbi:MAG: hypothetical protein ACFE95_00040 [Candidatus Hodarchaeota archaeon]